MADELFSPTRRARNRRMQQTDSLTAWLGEALLYPLRGHAGWMLLLMAGLLTAGLAGWFLDMLILALFGAPILVVAGAITIGYCYTCTEHSAQGEAEAPPMDSNTLAPFNKRLGSGLVFIMATLTLGPLLAWLLPAHLVLTGGQSYALQGMHPVSLLRTLQVLGRNGLQVSLLATGWSLTIIPAALWLPFPLFIAATLYALLLVSHLAGFAAWHAREALALTKPQEESRRSEQDMREHTARLMEEVLRLDNQRQREAAVTMLDKPPHPEDWPDRAAYETGMLRRLLENDKKGLARAWSRHVLTQRADNNGRSHPGTLTEFVGLSQSLGPERLPESASLRLVLARAAMDSGRRDLALDVLQEADGTESVLEAAQAALLRTRLLLEKGQDEQARPLLARLQKHPQTNIRTQAGKLSGLLR